MDSNYEENCRKYIRAKRKQEQGVFNRPGGVMEKTHKQKRKRERQQIKKGEWE